MPEICDNEWIELCQVNNEIEAEVIRSVLLAQGIEAFTKSQLPSRVYPGLAPLKVFVPRKDLELAKRIVEASSEALNQLS